MKRILFAVAAAAVLGAAFTGCNNKPPFVQLKQTVDSLNVVEQANKPAFADSVSVVYDEALNDVVYTTIVSTTISADMVPDEMADVFANQFTQSVLDDATLSERIVAAKASILVKMVGTEGGKYELRIDNKDFVEAYNARYGK